MHPILLVDLHFGATITILGILLTDFITIISTIHTALDGGLAVITGMAGAIKTRIGIGITTEIRIVMVPFTLG